MWTWELHGGDGCKELQIGNERCFDFYKMQNVQIKGIEPLAICVKYFCCNGTVLDINGQ
jgi:hypothetical protein